jgi:hypothetical protein
VATPSQYQRATEVKTVLKEWSSGQKSQALQQLLIEHFEDMPKRSHALERLDFLSSEFGTEFEVTRKGKTNQALRKATLVRVLERIALYIFEQDAASLPAKDDDQAEVVAALEALQESTGPQLTVSAAKAEAIRSQLGKIAKNADAETAGVLKELEALLKGGAAV